MNECRLLVLILAGLAGSVPWELPAATNAASDAGLLAAPTNSVSRLKFKFNFNSATNEEAEVESSLAPASEVMLPAARWPAPAAAGTNPTAPPPARSEPERLRQFESKLELARQQRLNKEFAPAEQLLVGLLESAAPMETKRSALLEMGLLAQDAKDYARAQQIYSQFLHLFHDDPGVPELLLRQGELYREMGAPVLALSKFYAVMSSALSLKLDRLDYYQRLVLQAQTEIAETYYLQGQFAEAADFFTRLLKLDNPQLNQTLIHCKLVRSYAGAARYPETVAQAELFLAHYPKAEQVPEMRFLLADALKRLGRKRESMQQVLALIQQPHSAGPEGNTWLYWQQRAGNEIANQLYQEGDCLNALEIYLRLAELNVAPGWRLPVWYQVGLIYERLKQPEKAAEIYTRILDSEKDLDSNTRTANLGLVVEMATWRKERLAWESHAELTNRQIGASAQPASAKPQLRERL